MAKKTEEEFAAMIAGVNLSEREKNVLREDVGLSPQGETETIPVLRKRLQMLAWSKLGEKNKKPTQREEDLSGPVLDKVLHEAREVGFTDHLVMGHGVLLGGFDHMKALQVKEFRDALTGGTGFINGAIAQRNMPAAKRVLMKKIVDTLKSKGAILDEQKSSRDAWTLLIDNIAVRLGTQPL